MQGTVKWFDAQKGYGLIAGEGRLRQVFVHRSALEGLRNLQKGDRVSYDLTVGPRGRTTAQRVRRVS